MLSLNFFKKILEHVIKNMKSVNVKTLMVFTLLSTSIFAMPIMAKGADDGEGPDMSQMDPRGFGSAFSSFGPGGEMIGQIFEVLFGQVLALGDQKVLEGSTDKGGAYVLSAAKNTTYSGNYSFSEHDEEEAYHFLPFIDNETGGNLYNMTDIHDWAYCKVEKAGKFEYDLTIGASLTLIIWDDDGSFIEAATKIIDFAISLQGLEGKALEDKILTEGIELATWLIVHINDIFTGDELFVFNPITWQKFEMDPDDATFSITKTWYDFGDNRFMEGGGGDDDEIDIVEQGWNLTAANEKDSYMQWLLTTGIAESLLPKIWTHFSFDLFQLWIKNFEIHIDFAGLSSLLEDEGTPNLADVFGGLDIEFYLFTHHLESGYLYNDLDASDDITVNYTQAEYENGTVIEVDGVPAMRPDTNELSHRLMLGNVESFTPTAPVADGADAIEWGITLNNAEIIPVPIGIDLNSYLNSPEESLSFIEFNCRFVRSVSEPDADGNITATGSVKLEHNFAPWNGGGGPINNITGLDMAIVYISSIFHFHLNIDNKNEETSELTQAEEDMEVEWDTTDNKSIRIGDYLADGDPRELIDIAGEDYVQDNVSRAAGVAGGHVYPASSQIVPAGLWSFSGDAHTVHTGDMDTTTDDFSSDISLDISFNVMYYAVCYPQFNGTGDGIWHDPTFNIYMVFTPNSAGFWALILLIASIGLAGVATIMIKKKKDRKDF